MGIGHTVYVTSIGGGMVLNCESLQITNIEYPYPKLDGKGIAKTILHYKPLSESDVDDMEITVVDNRPPEENYNRIKERESKQIKKDRNSMTTSKM